MAGDSLRHRPGWGSIATIALGPIACYAQVAAATRGNPM